MLVSNPALGQGAGKLFEASKRFLIRRLLYDLRRSRSALRPPGWIGSSELFQHPPACDATGVLEDDAMLARVRKGALDAGASEMTGAAPKRIRRDG